MSSCRGRSSGHPAHLILSSDAAPAQPLALISTEVGKQIVETSKHWQEIALSIGIDMLVRVPGEATGCAHGELEGAPAARWTAAAFEERDRLPGTALQPAHAGTCRVLRCSTSCSTSVQKLLDSSFCSRCAALWCPARSRPFFCFSMQVSSLLRSRQSIRAASPGLCRVIPKLRGHLCASPVHCLLARFGVWASAARPGFSKLAAMKGSEAPAIAEQPLPKPKRFSTAWWRDCCQPDTESVSVVSFLFPYCVYG